MDKYTKVFCCAQYENGTHWKQAVKMTFLVLWKITI